MKISDLLKCWRTMREKTVRQISKEIGISHATYSRIENGGEIDKETLMKLFNWVFSSKTPTKNNIEIL